MDEQGTDRLRHGADGKPLGTLNIDPETGEYTYTLTENGSKIVQSMNDGDVKTETFKVQVEIEGGKIVEKDITITIKGTNDRPELELLGGDDHRLVISTGTTPDGNATTHATITMTEDDKSFSPMPRERTWTSVPADLRHRRSHIATRTVPTSMT